MSSIGGNLQVVRARIAAAARAAGREPGDITMLAVSKTFAAGEVRAAYAAGQREFGEHYDWVHSVAREKIALRLAEARPAGRDPLDICLQVNLSGAKNKSGAAPEALRSLAELVRASPRLRLRGLMAIPEPSDDIVLQRRHFRALRLLLEQLNAAGFGLDTLSMGMSQDLEAAVLEGATIVRVGTAIFGERKQA